MEVISEKKSSKNYMRRQIFFARKELSLDAEMTSLNNSRQNPQQFDISMEKKT